MQVVEPRFYGGLTQSVNDSKALGVRLEALGVRLEDWIPEPVKLLVSIGVRWLARVAKIVAIERTAGLIGPSRVAQAAGMEPDVGHNESLPRSKIAYQATRR